jgi:hypothetical protein
VRLFQLTAESKHVDFTFDNVGISYWTCIEVNAAIACACMVTLKPLAMRMFPRLLGAGMDESPRDSAVPIAHDGRPLTIGSRPSRHTKTGISSPWYMGSTRPLDDRVPILEEEAEVYRGKSLDDIEFQLSPGLESLRKVFIKETNL